MNAAAQQRPLQLVELASAPPRPDHPIIARFIAEKTRVLDVGCGDGALLHRLARDRGVRGRGLDLNQGNVNACVAKGLTALQADADRDLSDFPDQSFHYVVLANVLQSTRRPRQVLKQAARIGEHVIVSIANYGHWRARMHLLTQGRVAPSPSLNARWCDSDNIHPCSVRDFAELARELRLNIERAIPLSGDNEGAPFAKSMWRANWFADEVVFLLAS